jgi:uncharacterized protein
MTGETNLQLLLRNMRPVLSAEPYGYAVAVQGEALSLDNIFATVREDEGLTLVAATDILNRAGLTYTGPWARITLHVHSSLEAVGLTAAFATALGTAEISANVIAGNCHDHIFVQWEKRHDAMRTLRTLSSNS